jgi:hypothetical protein
MDTMAKARKKGTPKPPQRQAIEAQASPELHSLIETHNALPKGDWNVGLAVKNRHGHESDIAKHVEKVFAEQRRGRELAFSAVMSFPARGYADIAAKLALASQQWPVSSVPPVSLAFSAAIADAKRLAQAAPSATADKRLLDLASDCTAALEVNKVLWARIRTEREEVERMADAAGYTEGKGYSPGESWQARYEFTRKRVPANSSHRANNAHKELGRTARAVFAIKAQTLRGAVAKLRLVVALINADELDTWQGDKDWLAETLADLERLTGGAT